MYHMLWLLVPSPLLSYKALNSFYFKDTYKIKFTFLLDKPQNLVRVEDRTSELSTLCIFSYWISEATFYFLSYLLILLANNSLKQSIKMLWSIHNYWSIYLYKWLLRTAIIVNVKFLKEIFHCHHPVYHNCLFLWTSFLVSFEDNSWNHSQENQKMTLALHRQLAFHSQVVIIRLNQL